MALTDKEVRALTQRSRRYRVSDGGGLLLEVDPAGGKYWLWRHRYPPTKDGRRQDLRIGPYPRISLKAARDLRDEQKRLLYEDGINPCDAKKRSKDQRWGKHAQLTFEAVALDWHATKTAGTWTERHSDDVIKKLNKDIFPAIGGMAIDAITAQDCLAVLRSIEQRGSNETAKRSLGVISQVLDYAVAIGHCTINPAHSLKRHAPVKQTTSHYPCIAWSELPELLSAMRANSIGADASTLNAIGLALAQIGLDQPCRFYPATALVQELQKARAEFGLSTALERLDRWALLVIDDIGYVRRDEQESSVLFELICHRYERRSLLITANQPFTAWEEIFPNGSMTVAAVDRLVHHCHILEISGASHRRQQARQRSRTRRKTQG